MTAQIVAYMLGMDLDEYFVSDNKVVKFTEYGLYNANGEAEDTLLGQLARGTRTIELSYGETYYMPRIVNNDISYESHIWRGNRKDIIYFDNHMIWLTREYAIQRAKALRDIGGMNNLSFGRRIEK